MSVITFQVLHKHTISTHNLTSDRSVLLFVLFSCIVTKRSVERSPHKQEAVASNPARVKPKMLTSFAMRLAILEARVIVFKNKFMTLEVELPCHDNQWYIK
jgi:hypothetical protein